MSHDELIEELAREHRYRNVLVVAAVIGVIASAVLGVLFTLGQLSAPAMGNERLGMFVLPFAASMVVGSGVHKILLARGRKRR